MKKNTIIILIGCTLAVGLVVALFPKKSSDNQSAFSPVETTEAVVPQTPKLDDFTLPDIKGQAITASSVTSTHRLTIIDFWASWCGPCMRELPHLKAIYEAYKDKGLGLMGVSLDTDRSRWLTTIEANGMTWTNVSDLKGWESTVAQQFNVNAIPYTLVVDQQGTIVAGGLRGESLRLFIEERLK